MSSTLSLLHSTNNIHFITFDDSGILLLLIRALDVSIIPASKLESLMQSIKMQFLITDMDMGKKMEFIVLTGVL